MTIKSELALEWDGAMMRLVALPDGCKLNPPWPYSEKRLMSLGMDRYQVEVDGSMSDEEIGQRLRARFGLDGRKTFLDVHAFTPTS